MDPATNPIQESDARPPELSLEDAPQPAAVSLAVEDAAAPPAKLKSPFRFNKSAFFITTALVVIIGVIGAAALFFTSQRGDKPSLTEKPSNYSVSDVPVSENKDATQLQLGDADQLTLNGELQVA